MCYSTVEKVFVQWGWSCLSLWLSLVPRLTCCRVRQLVRRQVAPLMPAAAILDQRLQADPLHLSTSGPNQQLPR